MSLFFGIYEIDLLVGSIIFLSRYIFLSGTCLLFSLGRYGGCYPTPDIFEWDPNYVDLGKLKKVCWDFVTTETYWHINCVGPRIPGWPNCWSYHGSSPPSSDTRCNKGWYQISRFLFHFWLESFRWLSLFAPPVTTKPVGEEFRLSFRLRSSFFQLECLGFMRSLIFLVVWMLLVPFGSF